MSEPFPIIDRAIYDDKTLNEQAGIDYGTLKKARKAGDIRYATLGKRHVYLGFWIFDWLSRISVAEASCQMEAFCPIQGEPDLETEQSRATTQGDEGAETDSCHATTQGEWVDETDDQSAQPQGDGCIETDTNGASPPTTETDLTFEPDFDQGGFDGRRRDW